MDDISEAASIRADVKSILKHATKPFYPVRPSAELIEIFIEMATNHDSSPLHVLAADTELKAVRNNFSSASRAADLFENDHLTLTPAVPEGWGTAVVTADTAHAFANVGGQELVLKTTDVPAGIRDTCNDYQDAGEQFSLRTPPWLAVTTTLTEAFGAEVCADFTTMIEAMDNLEAPAVNEADSALLVAARHELLLYNISDWAEDIELYSRATFSRAKGDLEDLGVITCEDVQVDVGRPRERLILSEEYTTLSESELLRKVNTIKSN